MLTDKNESDQMYFVMSRFATPCMREIRSILYQHRSRRAISLEDGSTCEGPASLDARNWHQKYQSPLPFV